MPIIRPGNGWIKSLFILGLAATVYGLEPEWISTWGTAGAPRVSHDGRYVIYFSKSRLTPDDEDKWKDVYLFDRKKKSLRLITHRPGKASYINPNISRDSRYITFVGYPESVLKGKPPRISEIFIEHRKRIIRRSLSEILLMKENNGEALDVHLSASGKSLVFSSNATNLLKKEKNAFRAVYFLDLTTKKLTLISKNTKGIPANRPSVQPQMSATGRFVAFKSAATNLEPALPATSLSYHLYLYEQDTDEMVRINQAKYGFDSDKWHVGKFTMNKDASSLIFEGIPKDVDEPEQALIQSELFEYKRRDQTVTWLTRLRFSGRAHSPSLDGKGRYLVFGFGGFSDEDEGSLVVWDRKKDQWQKLLDNSCRNPLFSYDGSLIVFESEDPKWRPGAKREASHVFVIANPFKY